MQVVLKDRETLSGVLDIDTDPVDVSGMSLLTFLFVVYSISGTTPAATVQVQTSNDLETWKDVGSSFNLNAAGSQTAMFAALNENYQRYVRANVSLTGTAPLVSYSLWLNLFPHA
jgi:hypothetical protein